MSNPLSDARRIILTGGPGSGKSTLIGALAGAGFRHMPEAGRAIIRQQLAIGGSALPWADRAAFAESMLGWELRSYEMAVEPGADDGPVFFDRGLPDVAGYLAVCGLPVPARMDAAIRRFRYARRVFIAPPWQEIFAQDAERRQDWAEAVHTYEAMIAIYLEYDYELVTLPQCSVSERLAFVLRELGEQDAV